MGQHQTFILYFSAGNYNQDVIFRKDTFKEALFENGAKSHNFTNLFFVMSHFRTL